MGNLQLCILLPRPRSPMTLEFPLYLGHAYELVQLFQAFCALPRRIHMRSMMLFSASTFVLLFLLRRYLSYSLFFWPFRFRFRFLGAGGKHENRT